MGHKFNVHSDRKIAIPKRRLKRKETTTSLDSTGKPSTYWSSSFGNQAQNIFNAPSTEAINQGAPYQALPKMFSFEASSINKPFTFNISLPSSVRHSGSPIVLKNNQFDIQSESPVQKSLSLVNSKLSLPTFGTASNDLPTPFTFSLSKEPVTHFREHTADAGTIVFGTPPATMKKSIGIKKTSTISSPDETIRVSSVKGSSSMKVTASTMVMLDTSKEVEKPVSTAIAFSKTNESDQSTSVLSLKPIPKNDFRESSFTLTTLKTEIIDPTQVSYATRLWELPETVRCEITQLQYFINQQRDKQNKINEQLHSLHMPMIKNIQTKTDNANVLEIQDRSLDQLIDHCSYQRLSIHAASSVVLSEQAQWHRGALENWQFFKDAVKSMEQRICSLSNRMVLVEEAVASLGKKKTEVTPKLLSQVMIGQKRMYISLAGRVAELHEQAEHIIKKRRLQ
ncbi:hypothetical protein G6F46_006590 [Rhizopus delemar]|uniref:Uncharacterized protein n=2 Tax=Rhizopus TaxID=4842 RepID=A0A9P6Z9Z1_9FUNG|nr:hypothetical protein G6F55_001842 [Rhizopus delemar]KAG1550623.1 hypothetical protein G6F51_002340 [Rhizopus arrhizus]KAG1496324.1 hypothetical protein G6F54_006549 [Rhizopus delemar]KAG1517292.1 hypothetical protein G6F53_001479 [Rhizopus delemar]KAG1526095.1 hypothetical protein G6F52_002740 [Rhizopus delemar]